MKEIYELRGRGHSARGDCPGVGVGAEHCVLLLEFAGGDETEAAATARVQAGPLRRVP